MTMLANYEVKNKQIGDYTFYVRAFPPLVALDLLGDLQSVVTTSLGGATAGSDEENKNLLDKQIDIGAVIAGLGSNLKGPVLVKFADRILNQEYVSVDIPEEGTVKLSKAISDKIFTAHIKDMLELMFFVLEVNYSDFFDSVPNLSGFLTKLGGK